MIQNHKAMGVVLLGFGIWRVGSQIKQGFASPVAVLPSWQ